MIRKKREKPPKTRKNTIFGSKNMFFMSKTWFSCQNWSKL